MKPHDEILRRKGFSIQESLGRGGQYYAYRAEQSGRGDCAIRVFKELVENSEDLPREIRDELKTASKLRGSPYFSTLIDWFIEDGWLFTVWDFAEHGSLRDVINRGNPLSREQAIALLESVARGLDQIHELPGAHGDIKPENLLVYSNGFVKIGDLGIARLITSATTRQTNMGSTDYLLPQKHSGAPSHSRDLFGFAVTYAELRLGRHPYGCNRDVRLQNLIKNRPDLSGLEEDEQSILVTLLQQDGDIDWVTSLAEWLKSLTHVKPYPGSDILGTSKLRIIEFCIELEGKLKFRNRCDGKVSLGKLVEMEVAFSNWQRKQIFKAVNVRNRLVHASENQCSVEEMQEAIDQLVWAIAFLDGEIASHEEPHSITNETNDATKHLLDMGARFESCFRQQFGRALVLGDVEFLLDYATNQESEEVFSDLKLALTVRDKIISRELEDLDDGKLKRATEQFLAAIRVLNGLPINFTQASPDAKSLTNHNDTDVGAFTFVQVLLIGGLLLLILGGIHLLDFIGNIDVPEKSQKILEQESSLFQESTNGEDQFPQDDSNFVRMELVHISPGTFIMGSSESKDSDEQPAHEVTIADPFGLESMKSP